ncbi:MAG: GRP family sugar transporter [Acidimicrobiales bacterium]
MAALLALITVVAWGTWIPVAQAMPDVPQRSRTFYVTVGNVVFAALALVAGGGHLSVDWRHFWLPFAGGMVWTAGSYSAFRATQTIGLARADGTWAPLNIVVAFVWGALLFGELDGFTGAHFALVGGGLVLVFVGVLLIIRSQDERNTDVMEQDTSPESGATVGSSAEEPAAMAPGAASTYRRGLLWAGAAGVLWGSYFVPAQWAKIPAQVSNFPLALGILAAGSALALRPGQPLRLRPKVTAVQLTAGLLFGIGNLALLGLVTRVGTGVGFTIAQLSLLVNASIGVWMFKVPRPGSRAARIVLAGILIAGIGGVLVGSAR